MITPPKPASEGTVLKYLACWYSGPEFVRGGFAKFGTYEEALERAIEMLRTGLAAKLHGTFRDDVPDNWVGPLWEMPPL